jgi:hypothetical protein
MRGDAVLVVRDADRLLVAREAFDALPGLTDDNREEISFLAPTTIFRNDGLRRIALAARPPSIVPPPAGHTSLEGPVVYARNAPVDPAVRIRALLAEFDQIDARQDGQPGGVALQLDRRVRAIIEIGEPAIEPLLDTLEHDPRLTQSVHFWRDFSPSRNPIYVYEAAYVAIANILGTSFAEVDHFSTGDDISAFGEDMRRELVESIRAYWTRVRGHPRVERIYLTLADDTANTQQWLEAAGALVTDPRYVTLSMGSMAGTSWSMIDPSRTGPMFGEPLRSRANPSVGELLARRATEALTTSRATDPSWTNTPFARFARACSLTGALAHWDPAATGLLAGVIDRWIASPMRDDYQGRRDDCLAAALLALDRAGNPGALDRYLRWVPTLSDHSGSERATDILPLAARHPTDARVMRWTSSVLRRGRWLPARGWPEWFGGIDQHGLTAIASLRATIVAGLRDGNVVGTLTVDTSGAYTIRTADGDSSSSGNYFTDGVYDSGQWHWRECDQLARAITTGEERVFPTRGSDARRDEFIRAMIDRLEHSQVPP